MRYFLLFLFVFTTVSNQAQVNPSSLNYHWVNNSNGLPQLGIYGSSVDDNGFVWIATNLGIYRYDGLKVVGFENSNVPEISNKRITNLFKDPVSGELYFKTYPNDQDYVIKNNTINKINENQGAFLNTHFFLKSTNPFYKPYINLIKSDTKVQNNSRGFSSVCMSKDFMYFVFENSVGCIDKRGRKTIIEKPGVATSKYICKIGNAILTMGKRIGLIKNNAITFNSIKTDTFIRDFLNSEIAPMTCDGEYYLNHKQKLYKICFKDNYLYTEYLLDMPTNDCQEFYYDKKNDLYFIGTINQGLAVVAKKKFNIIQKTNKYNFTDYTVVQKKQKWYNYNGWVYDANNKKLQSRSIDNYFGDKLFLLEYKGDYFYQATENRLLSIVDLKTKAPFKLDNKLGRLMSYTYLNKKLWLANRKWIGFLDTDEFVFDTIVTQKLKKEQTITTIKSINQNLIIGTSIGVFLHKPFTSQFDCIKGLENVNARYIKLIDNNNFWVGCYGEGLFLVYNDKVYPVNNSKGNIKTIHAIEEDKAGNLWISTNNGLITVNKKSALKSILNYKPIDTYVFTVSDGLPNNEFNGGSTHPSLNYKNEVIGFPSMKGFVWFEPKNVKKQLFRGGILIDKIVVNNNKIVLPKNNCYSIDKEVNILNINFSYGYHFNRENLNISYSIDNQSKWTAIDGNSFQIGRLEKGKHKLSIRIKTRGFDDKYDIVKTAVLDFKPLYYETFSFWVIIFFISLFFMILSYYLGLYFQNNKKMQLNKIISLKTSELNTIIEELESSENIIKQSLIEKELLLKEVHHRVKNNLQLIMSMLNIQSRRENYDTIQDFLKNGETRIISMSLIHESLYQSDNSLSLINFQLYIEELTNSINQIFDNNKQQVQIEVDAKNIFLNLTTSIPLGLIINELVTNALKHAFPTNKNSFISIVIKTISSDQFVLVFQDNGIGFDKDKLKKKSFGLELIDLLVLQLNGKLQFESGTSTKYVIYFQEIKA